MTTGGWAVMIFKKHVALTLLCLFALPLAAPNSFGAEEPVPSGSSVDPAGAVSANAPSALPAAERLSRALRAAERARRSVRQILDETNATYMTLWTYDEVQDATAAAEGAVPAADTGTRRARNWEAFYRDPDPHLNYEQLAAQCIAETYPRYFNAQELDQLADFLERPKTREDVTAFAATPLGRKYRSVMRRLSSDTILCLERRVHAIMESVLEENS